MGWERRKRGGLYYVQKEQVGGKVVSRYLGAGEVATLAAQLEEGRRQEQEAEREQEKQKRAEIDKRDQENAAYFAQVETIFRQAMEAAGYYRHNRGAWRKKRDRDQGRREREGRQENGKQPGQSHQEGGPGRPAGM